MTSTMDGVLEIALNSNWFFTDTMTDDFVIRTQNANQNIAIGVAPNAASAIYISSNLINFNKPVSIGGGFQISGQASTYSNLTVGGNATICNNIIIGGNTTLCNPTYMQSNLVVTGTTTLSNNLLALAHTSLSNTLNVSGSTTLSNTLTVTSNMWVMRATSLSNTLNVSGTTTLSNALTVTSNLWVNGAASLSNNLNVFGSATVSNITTLQSNLVVAGTTTLSNNLYVLNPTSLSNTLDVSGRISFSNALTVTSNLWVNGATSLSNNLNVFGSATVSNITTLQSNLVVAGTTTLSNNLYVLNPTSLSNTLDVSGRTTLSNALTVTSNLWVNGATSLSNNLNVFGSATVSNVTTLQSNLVVAGMTTLSNNLYVLNPTSLSNTLDVSGRISFSNALTVTSNLWVNGATSLSNALNVSGVSTFSNAVQVTSNVIVGGSTSLSNPVTMSSNLATYGTATICNVTTLNSNLTFSNMGMVTVYTSNNNLGINTSNPTNKLSIVGGLSVLNNIQSYSYPNAIVPPGNVPQGAATYSSGGITYTFSNAGGNGVNAAWIFDGSTSTTYFDGLGAYNTGAGGVYGGTAPSTSNISGAWLQTLSSAPFILTSYAFSSTSEGIREWYVFGSTDGTTWTQLDRVALSSWTYGTAVTTFNITNPTAQYSYYRFVINKGFSGAPVVNDFKWYALTSLSTVGGSLLICASNSSEQFEFSGGNAKFYQNVYTLSNMAVGKSNPAYTLDVAGTASISGNTVVGGTATFSNSVTMLSNLTINGNFSLGTSFIAGSVSTSIGSNLVVGGTSTLSNNVNMLSNSYVAGKTTLSNTLDVAGTTTLSNALTVTSNLWVNGATSLSNTLNVSGVSTFSNAITVTSNINVKGLGIFENNTYVVNTFTPAVSYPPPASTSSFTSGSVTVSGQVYGNGAYTIIASSQIDQYNPGYYAYDSSVTNQWMSASRYNAGTGNYTGGNSTTVGSSNYPGEWVDITLPNSITLSNINIISGTNQINYGAKDFYVVGSSNNGVSWDLLIGVTGYSSWTLNASSSNQASTFSVTNGNTNSYNRYRIIVNKTVLWDFVRIQYISLFAYTGSFSSMGVRTSNPTEALDVVGNTKVNNNLFVLSNLGIGKSNPLFNLDLVGNACISGSATLSNTLNVSGAATVSNALTVTSNLWVNGETSLSNNLNVFGTATVSNIATLQSNLVVTGPATFSNNANFLSNLTIMGQLTVSNVTYITSNITIYSSETIQSNLAVFNHTTLCNAVNIYGATTTYADIITRCNLQMGCNLTVGGNTTLSNPALLLSNLVVNGTVAFSNSSFYQGRATFSNVAVFNSNIALSNFGTVNLATSNNMLGINTTAPTEALDFNGGNAKYSSNVYVLSKLAVGFSNPQHGTAEIAGCNVGGDVTSLYLRNIGSNNSNNLVSMVFGANQSSGASGQAKVSVGNENFNSGYGFLAFYTNSNAGLTERMRVTAQGFTGIGTSNPTNPLHVYSSSATQGAVSVQSTTSNMGARITLNNTDDNTTSIIGNNTFGQYNMFGIGTSSISPMVFVTSNAERARIDSMGNMGVGTAAPAYKVDIIAGTGAGVTNCNALRVWTQASNATYADAVVLSESAGQPTGKQAVTFRSEAAGGTYVKSRIWSQVGAGYNATMMGFDVADSSRNTQTRMVIDVAGNIGMNNTAPTERLQLTSGNAKFDCNVYAMTGLGVGTSNLTQKVNIVGTTAISGTPLTGQQNTAAAAAYILMSTTDNNTGPGLAIQNIASNNQAIYFDSYYNSNEIYSTATAAYSVAKSNSKFLVRAAAPGVAGSTLSWGTAALSVISTGSVGINNEAPTERLDLKGGNAKFDCNVYVGSNLGINNSNPQYALDVVGAINFTGVLNQNGSPFVGSRWTSNTQGIFYNYAPCNVGIGTSSLAEKFNVDSGNAKFGCNVYIMSNLGIGKSNPAVALDVAGSANITGSTVITGTATFSNPINALSNFTANGPVLFQNTFTTSNVATFNSNVVIQGQAFMSNFATFCNNVTMLSNLSVNGTASFSNTLGVSNVATFSSNVIIQGQSIHTGAASFSNPTTLLSNLSVNGPAAFSNTLGVSNIATFTSNVVIQGQVNITGAVIMSNILSVSNVATFSSNIVVQGSIIQGGAVTLCNPLAALSNMTIQGTLNVSNVGTFASNVIVQGQSVIAGTATFSNPVTMLSNLSVNGPIAFSNTLGVSNIATFTSNVFMQGLSVHTGTATFSNPINALSNLTVNGLVAFSNTLGVSNVATFTSNVIIQGPLVNTGTATFSNPVNLLSNLTVTGPVTFSNTLGVSNVATFTSNIIVSGTATFSNHTSLLNNLTVTGPVTLSNTLNVSNVSTFTSNVIIQGQSVHTGSATFSNTLGVSNVATFTSNVIIQGQSIHTGTATFSNPIISLSNIGIGKTNPATALDIVGNTSTTGYMSVGTGGVNVNSSNYPGVLITSTGTQNAIITADISGKTGMTMGVDQSDSKFKIQIGGGLATGNFTSPAFTIGNGLVGIGTSNPASTLAVAGGQTIGVAYSNVVAPTNGLLVQGQTTLCNNLNVNGSVSLNNTLGVSNVATFTSSVIVAGTATFSNPITALSNLTVNGPVSFSNTLGVSNIATFTSNVIIQGLSVHTGTATFSNPINALSNLTVNGPVSFSNTLGVSNVATFLSNVVIQGQLTVSNVTYITSNITIYSSEIIQSNLTVTNNTFAVGAATFCNPVLMLSNLTTLGQTTFCNTLTALSNIVLSNVNSTVFLATSNNFLGVGRSNPDKLLTLGPVSAAISNPTLKMYNFSNSTFEIILSDSNTGVLPAAGQGDTVLRSMSNIVLTTLQPAFTSNVITAVTNAPTNHVTRAFATDLTQANASSVSSWGLSNPFTQGTTSQQPIYYSSGGFSNTSYVSFVTASNSHLSRTNLTYNINTNGGFTIISMMRFNTNQSFPRIFTAGGPGYIEWSQSGLSMTFNMGGSGGPGNFAISTGNVISIGEWAVFTVRLNGSTNATSIYKNYTSVASGTSAYNSNVTMTTNYIGRSLNADPYLTANISYFLIYDSFVPDATLSNVVSAMFSSGSMTSTSYFNSLVLGSNSVSISGTTIQGGTATFCNTTNMLSNLTVSGPASFSNVATFTSNITSTGIATFCNQINALSNLTVYGIATFSNTLGVSNIATFTSNVIIQGQSAHAGAATFSNITTFASNVFVQGQVSIAASNISMSNYGRAVLYSSNNNFGIGTQNPLTPLHIQGDATISGQLNLFTRMRSRGINIALNQGTPPSVSAIQSGFTTTNGTVNISTPGSNVSDSIVFITGSNPNSEKMRITGTGAVGIGTNSPAYTLDVNGDGRILGTLNIGTNTQAAILSLDDIPGARWELNTAGNVLNFLNDSTGSFVTKMGISSTGSLEVQNALTVNSNATVRGTFGCSNTGTFNNNLLVGGVLSVGGAVNLSNNTTVLGTFGVSNVATFSNNATVIGTLGVSNNTTLGGTLTVGNVATFNSNVIINGTMTVSNVTYVTSNIYIYSSEVVQSNLTIYNATTMCNVANVYNVLTAYSNIAMSNANGIITIFTSNSSLGIGTSNPAEKLDVNGAINALGYCNLMVNSFSSTSLTQVPTASNLTVAYNIAVVGSNAGIWGSNLATTNSNALYPQATFASNAGAFGSNTAFAASNYAYTNIPGISNIAVAGSNAGTWGSNLATTSSNVLFPQATFASNAGAFGSNTVSAASNQAFNTWAYSNTIIYNLGSNVGVNTSNSVHRLNVNGDIWGKTLSLRPDGTYDYIASNLLPNYGLGVSNNVLNVMGNGGLNMRTGTNSNAIFVTSAGLVGISNPTPSAQLDVAGTSFRVRGGASATPTTFFLNDTGTSGTTSVIQFVNNTHLIACTDSNPFSGVTGTGAGHQMYYISDRHNFRSNVNVTGTLTATTLGVGTTTPAYALDVKGTISGTSNLYIGSNVGPGQSNNIDLTGATGNIIASGNISAGNLGMFRNRIINGDMAINQRGIASSNISGFTYVLDRFSILTQSIGTMSFTNNSLNTNDAPYQYGFRYSFKTSVASASSVVSSTTLYQRQLIEGYNTKDFNWGQSYGTPITISFWSKSSGVTNLPVTIANAGLSYCWNSNIAVANNGTWQYNSLTVQPPPVAPTGTWDATSNASLQLMIGSYSGSGLSSSSGWISGFSIGTTASSTWFTTVGNYVEITGVQLERGSIATPFEFRPYAMELQLCQRYFCTSYDVGTAPGTATENGKLGTYSTATSAMLTAYYPVIMRTIPNVTVYGGNTGTVGCANIGGTSTNVTANKIVSTKSVNLFVYDVGQANNFYYFHYDASAEL